jgi:hypothetical protein
LALAVLIGVIYVFRRNSTSICAAKAGAKASFIIGAAFMLFSYEKRWWPAGATILALGSWVIAGWLAAWLGYYAGVYIREVIRRTKTRPQEAGRMRTRRTATHFQDREVHLAPFDPIRGDPDTRLDGAAHRDRERLFKRVRDLEKALRGATPERRAQIERDLADVRAQIEGTRR